MLQDARTFPRRVGQRDLASLLRHSLRYEQVFFSDDHELTVPTEVTKPFPDPEIWKQHGITARREGDRYRIQATGWPRPDWLTTLYCQPGSQDESSHEDPMAPSFGEAKRHPPRKAIPLDPALEGKFDSIATYWSQSQAETIRGVMLSRPGSTHLMVFPTGSGKSLIGLAASMAGHSRPSGITIVIVPTVALALDQVEQARLSFPGANINAWESGTPPLERTEIKERIRDGSQTFLYTSPESLLGALKTSVLEAAERKFIRTFIVDEAHLVSQWGASFRTSFQTMSALWSRLREACNFRTILMSATITKQTYQDLKLFFDRPDSPLEVSASLHLRPEIDFYYSSCNSSEEKAQRIQEVLCHAPRPAILYVTKVQDCRDWYEHCRSSGWSRIGLLHGKSLNTERKSTIDAWRKNKIDLMVATSAFGLGMDKGDIRTVIHGCVPETIDRYYQEVGRGGRDGNAAVTFMIHDGEDHQTARTIGNPKIIGDQLGLERWQALFHSNRETLPTDCLVLDLNAKRPDIEKAGDYNREWNLRTLVLLARSKILEFQTLEPPHLEQQDDETEKDFQDRKDEDWRRHWDSCGVSLLQANPLNEEDWAHATHQQRSEIFGNQQTNWKAINDVLSGDRPLREVLRNMYEVHEAGIEHVSLYASDIHPRPPKNVCDEVSPTFHTFSERYNYVTYPTQGQNETLLALKLSEFLQTLAHQGIREIALPTTWRENHDWYGERNPLPEITAQTKEKFLIVRILEEEAKTEGMSFALPVPRVTLLPPELLNDPIPNYLFPIQRPVHLFLVPEEMKDPANEMRSIGDTRPDVISMHLAINILSRV